MLTLKELSTRLQQHFGDLHWWPAATSFEVIVGAILTQNTNWNNVEKAIANLKAAGLLDLKALAAARIPVIERAVRPTGYYRQKARRLKSFVSYLYKRTQGDLRRYFKRDLAELREELLSQHGIGQETADSILLYAGNRRTFVIDAYTRRILERINRRKFRTYDKYRLYFEKNVPPRVKLYNQFHALLVELGKNYCKKKPSCRLCPIKKRCNYYARNGKQAK